MGGTCLAKLTVLIFSTNRCLLYFTEMWRITYKYLPCFVKTEAFPVAFLGTGEVNVVEAESLLAPFLQQFPNVCLEFEMHVSAITNQAGLTTDQSVCFLSPQGSLMLFYHARIELLKGNVEEVIYLGGSNLGSCL